MTAKPRLHTYKQTPQGALRLLLLVPPMPSPQTSALDVRQRSSRRSLKRSAILFFCGGGWLNCDIEQFMPQCRYFAGLGMIAAAAEYRVANTHRTSARESVLDARSAVRWLRRRHDELGLDPARLCAAGGSAGGHLAICTALPLVPAGEHGGKSRREVEEAEEPTSCRPDALILYNPVLDTSENGFGYERMGGFADELSPIRQVGPGMPPALLLHGEEDETVPFSTAERFSRAMKAEGNRCRLVGYPGQRHGFFNPGRSGGIAYRQTLNEATRFLRGLGYLEAESSESDGGPA